MRIEFIEQSHQLLGVAKDEGAVDFLLVLEEDAGLGILKNDVGERIAARRLLLDLSVQNVLGVFGFPVTARQAVAVAQGGRQAGSARRPTFQKVRR